jgi:hypothetical protein
MDVASGRTGMRAKALASQQARSQKLDCNKAVARTQNMRLRNAFACPRQCKTWIELELQHGSYQSSPAIFR